MRNRCFMTVLVMAGGATLAVIALGGKSSANGVAGPVAPADAGLCDLINTRSWGRVGDIHAYSIRTATWNLGDEPLVWQEFTPEHPLMAQNLYRYRNGRMEQIGLSWIKHGFCALQQAGCGDCFVQGGCLDFLGPGCRDPYSANLNGNQTRLGPRSEVNASTTEFPYPYVLGWGQTGDAIYKRIQVQDNDLNPALNDGATYYIEGQIMHVQEGTAPIRHNNATHEQVIPTAAGNTYELGFGMNTTQLLPAIYAWQSHDVEVVVQAVDVPGDPVDGRFHLAYRVFDNGNGTWRYEYALHNMNSHRSGSAFTVPLLDNTNVFGTFHRDVKYHSGEVYTNEDWALAVDGNSVSWSGMGFAENENANALRWGTMFNFSVTTDAPPVMGNVTLALFRPGTPDSIEIAALVPGKNLQPCAPDTNADNQIDVVDLLAVINGWGFCSAPCPPCITDVNGDCETTVTDLLAVINAWGQCN